MMPETRLHGFTVDRVREVPELNASIVEMTHDKTGASLVWLDNGELNKLFCVAFKTLPEDSTGVFHILEHSVLCGSEKYPVKEPFVELIKSSMNTFLNAMTFSDKTIYPVSSRNEQDFMNLTEVYLDAVFAPAILKNPNIFYQEGWHLEQDEAGKPSYKGVVFNEMKGAMSDVNELVYQKMLALLFPENCYGFNSGGDPTVIPQLTYAQFIDMYKRYYHPSNARIYLDGAVPLDRVLPLIDGYLSRHERSEEKHEIAVQMPRACEATQSYALAAEEDPTDRGYLSLAKIVGSWENKTSIMAVDVLMDVLMGSNEAPLKKALLDSGLCQDVSFMLDNSIAQPWLTLTFTNIKDGKADELRGVVRRTCRELVEKGLDKAALTASINLAEFHARAPHEPAALMRCINILNTWLHDGDPIEYLQYDADFAELRGWVEEGQFNELLASLLLDERTMAVLHTLPSKTYEAEMQADEEARLAATVAAWEEDDRQANIALNAGLAAWQQTPDTAEQLATLPMLDVKDIPEECPLIPLSEKDADGATVLIHDLPTGGVTHFVLSVKLTDCTMEDLPRLSLMVKLLGELPTKNYTAAELSLACRTYLGTVHFGLSAIDRGVDGCIPLLTASCAVLDRNIEKARELVREILTATDFTDKTRIRNSLLQEQERVRQDSIGAGHRLGMSLATASLNAARAAEEAFSGVTYMKTVKAFCEDFDGQYPALAAVAKRLQEECVCRSRMTLSITSDHADEVEKMLGDYPQGIAAPEKASYVSAVPAKNAYTIPAQIGYACMAADLRRMGKAYDGVAAVVSNILSYSCLWNAVRVQGGAYGCGMRIGRSGVMMTYSFRDPTPARTLGVYREMAKALKDFTAGEEKVEKYIISTVAECEPPLGTKGQMDRADQYWWAGCTASDLQAERSAMLRTDDAALLSWCGALEQLAENGSVSVVAHDGAVKACEKEHLTDL